MTGLDEDDKNLVRMLVALQRLTVVCLIVMSLHLDEIFHAKREVSPSLTEILPSAQKIFIVTSNSLTYTSCFPYFLK